VSNPTGRRSIRRRRAFEEFLKLYRFLFCSERYYTGLKEDPALKVKLAGNWETIVGEQDTFVHILEYENYSGLDKTIQAVRSSSKVRFLL